MKKIAISIISIGLICIFAGVASAAIIEVPSSECSTIQAGIDKANDGDTVLVADGVYTDEGNKDLVFGGKIITLQSENGPANSIIDCEGVGRALSSKPNTSAKDVVIEGFTIKNGVANRGGAIHWGYTSANLTIEDCIFRNNYNSAIWTSALKDDSTVTIIDCDFISNEGAVLSTNGGGAVTLANGGNAVITDCGFYDNTSTFRAGAIRILGNTTTDFKNCIFTGNTTNHDAGAISFEYGINRLVNCIFAGNRAGGRGGAIYTSHISTPSSLTIINSTLIGNKAHTGGAIWHSADSSPIITNSILWKNMPDEIDGNGDPTVNYSYIQGGYTGEGNIGGAPEDDPKFVAHGHWDENGFWIDGDYHLTSDSPCIDKGKNEVPGLPASDFEGDSRIVDGNGTGVAIVDMGADEYLPSEDSDSDGILDSIEFTTGTDPSDDDTDNDGLLDGPGSGEDTNANGVVDKGETDPRNFDTDGDGIQDGTEKGCEEPEGEDTEMDFFIPDADASTTTDPLDPDTDGDGLLDGEEDTNANGQLDEGETDPGIDDSDGDGILDDSDSCLDSDISPTVVISGCDSGVTNTVLSEGCSITDLIAECAASAKNHGKFVSCVAHLTNELKKDGVITGKEKGAIQSCAAQANLPQDRN